MTVLGNHMPLKKQLVQIKYRWDLEHVKAPSMVEVLAFRGCLVVAAPNHTTSVLEFLFVTAQCT